MSNSLRWLAVSLGLLLSLGAATDARGQADPQNYLFNSGQTIQPFFDGWSHNPDGGFEMYFGYLNRNYVEEQAVPIGQDNRMTPDGPDRGQPTFFYPRVNRRAFSVGVPADWGDTELIWQVTVRDETYRAVGWLQPEWEIAAPGGGRSGSADGATVNQPPTLVVDAPQAVAVAEPVTMTATVSDDGLPEPRERRGGGGRGTLPTFERNSDGPTLPINVPQIQGGNRSRPTRTRVDRINVTWTQWHGPTGVTLESQDQPDNDVATVTATFEKPGDYLFKVQASDGRKTVTEQIAVIVR